MEGITQTILDLTRELLADSGRAGELEEILVSRDPVRLVTSRSLFQTPPLALVEFVTGPGTAGGSGDGMFASLLSRDRYHDVRGILASIAEFTTGPGEGTLRAALAACGQPGSGAVLWMGERGLVLTSADRAEPLARLIRDGFRRATGGLTVDAVIEPLWPDEALLGRSPDLQRPPRFGVLLDALARRRHLSARPVGGTWPVIPGFVQRCGACHLEPATFHDETGHVFLCGVCRRGRELSGAVGAGETLDEAPSLEALVPADRQDGSGHLAVVAVCVDEIEPLVVELGGLDQVHLTVGAIDRAVMASIAGLIERLGLRRRYLRLARGVGSVVLVVPASRALDAVRRLVEGTETQLSREADALGGYPEIQEGLRSMRLRVGLCLAPVQYPARVPIEMAIALTESARRVALRVPGNTPVSTIDFWVLADGVPHATAVDELRYQTYESRRDVRLSRRPYTFPDFKREILDLFRAFRRLPRTEALDLRKLILTDPRASDINFRHQLVRSEEWRLFATEAVGRDPARWESLLFRTVADGTRETGFLDLIELTEFVD